MWCHHAHRSRGAPVDDEAVVGIQGDWGHCGAGGGDADESFYWWWWYCCCCWYPGTGGAGLSHGNTRSRAVSVLAALGGGEDDDGRHAVEMRRKGGEGPAAAGSGAGCHHRSLENLEYT